MELKDALAPFLPAKLPANLDCGAAPPCVRVAFLTERFDLKALMKRTLQSDQIVLTQVCSTVLIEKAIDKRLCDVAIVDIERQDEWSDLVFRRFDEAAAEFPVIILCKDRRKILNYLWKAQHVIDIVPYETIKDPRFSSLIEAAAFRADITKDIGFADNWDWTPPSAA